ncbi:MAG: sugar diacid recognition domain-containing protein [Eubacteriales bacterium]|nr:sugar diacid recognition domain-containing protein [Eubacteriales bacterium]
MIDEVLARKFIDKIASYTPHNVNIINEQGRIIAASKDVHRVGDFHEAAWQMLQKDSDVSCVTQDDSYLGVQPGVNLVLTCKGKKLGVVGVTGNPDEIYDIALIIKMSLETMIEYESHYELIQERKNSKLQFLNTLLYTEDSDVQKELSSMAKALGYQPKLLRLSVLICFDTQADRSALLEALESSAAFTSQDITHITRNGNLLLFKSFSQNADEIFADYRFLLDEALHEFFRYLEERNLTFHVYVGSFQNNLAHYRHSFSHCRWLKHHFKSDGESYICYFYDYVREYLTSQIPFPEIHQIYNVFSASLTPDFQKTLIETVTSLEENNYNLNTTSKKLFIHKNTLVFRFNKIKQFFHMNPFQESSDRNFLWYLAQYLRQKG